MTYLSVGVDHEHASLDLLERMSVPEDKWGKVLGALLANANVHEAVFVSTCLRTEVYAVIERFHGAVDEVMATLSDATGVPAGDFADFLTIHFDRGVATHLFRVASGLRSAVPGEYEVLGQVRRALERADEEHTAGPELAELFRRALATGRRVRHETTISRGTTSFAQACVDMAVHELGAELDNATVVVLGAGQLAAGITKCLADVQPPLGRIEVLNRTVDNAHALVTDVADARVSAGSLSRASDAVRGARLVIAALEAPASVLGRQDLSEIDHDVLVIDLGMPRVVDPSVDDLTHVTRRDISHLRAVVERTLAERHEAIDSAQALVEIDVEKFHEDLRSRGAAAIVGDLRERLEVLRHKELERRRHEFAALSDEQFELVESITRSVIAKVAHAPTMALKEAAGTDRGQRLSDAARSLFDL